ncbi:hypothetical protein U1Q18_044015, partial [Sarracenia purpurea var. burkii]
IGGKGVVCGAGTCSVKHGRGFRRGVSISSATKEKLGSEIRRRKIGSELAIRVSTDRRLSFGKSKVFPEKHDLAPRGFGFFRKKKLAVKPYGQRW